MSKVCKKVNNNLYSIVFAFKLAFNLFQLKSYNLFIHNQYFFLDTLIEHQADVRVIKEPPKDFVEGLCNFLKTSEEVIT